MAAYGALMPSTASRSRQTRTGVVPVNGAFPGFDVPFGGYKCSGIGRAFGSVGLSEYLEYKAIAV